MAKSLTRAGQIDDWDRHWSEFGEAAERAPAVKYRRRLIFRLLDLPAPSTPLQMLLGGRLPVGDHGLDAPILISSVVIISTVVWRRMKQWWVSPRDLYLACSVIILLGVALSAHIAGSRNLLQFLGVLCLVVGAFFDDAFGNEPRMLKLGAAVIVMLSAINIAVLSVDPHRIPYFATDGYRAFVRDKRELLGRDVSAVVYGAPILEFYAAESHTRLGWKISEFPWTTRADAVLPPAAQYALVSELVYRYMPSEQPVQRVIANQWKLVWSFKSNRSWGLRLYQKP